MPLKHTKPVIGQCYWNNELRCEVIYLVWLVKMEPLLECYFPKKKLGGR
jgi:hypothetical protein